MWKKIEFAIVLLLLAVLIMMSNHLEEMVSSGRVTVYCMYRMYGEDDARAWARMVIELAS